MRIVKVFDQTIPYVSGYSMRSRYVAESLRDHGVAVKVFSSPIFAYQRPSETIHGIEYQRTMQSRWNARLATPIIREASIVHSLSATICKYWPSDGRLVHAHSSLLNGIAAQRAASKLGVPFLYEARAFWEDAAVDQGRATESGLRYKLTRQAETRLFRAADHITVICEGLKNDVVQRGINPDRITVIPNGVDTKKFLPISSDTDLRRELGLSDKYVFGFIGTFFHFEGLRLLVDAAAQIVRDHDDVHFLLVGAGQEDQPLRAMVREKQLEQSVTFTGRVQHDEILRYYSVVDTLVYPRISKRITELVTPLKPLEAMALRKTVLGSRVGGIRELVDDGKTGLLFDADSVDDLESTLRYALEHPSEMQKLAQNGHDYVIQERSWSAVSQRYLPIYV